MESQTGSQTRTPNLPKQPTKQRSRLIWPLVLTANLAVGAYLLTRPKKDTSTIDEEVPSKIPSAPVPATASTTAAIENKPIIPRKPIPEDQQRQLFTWVLEEKRKVKTKDREEKKRIEEEKAILKQFIRAKTIPEIK